MALAIEPFGDAAVRVPVPPDAAPDRLLAALRSIPGVIDAIVAERHAVVTFAPGEAPEAAIAAALDHAGTPPDGALPRREHSIAVVYDGPDLDDVARRARLSVAEVAAVHCASSYRVAAVGFLPGFAYLRGLDPRLVGPRRATPRERVPANAVAIGGPYAGVYPFASPGGWQLLGTARGFTGFDASRGATLALGDTVRFVRVEP